ncbi:carbonic anhydrase-like isoform X2 [Chelonus insularis]|uniref:carbonic anhydrase-like isoform X2 n=1 Tax=Chelonus insularis TaxID=460826 RepID=UPI00158A25A8|nr:carbonic anhydrase-like isoform X2 [Chelonus insularis]
MKFLKIVMILIVSCLYISSSTADFNYRDTRSWARRWPACGGRRQSPIDFTMRNVDESHRNHKIKFNNYGVMPKEITIHNIGWTVRADFAWDDEVPIISGGFFNGSYRLDTWYFHWDARSNNGSEHTAGGRSAAMELQHLYYKSEYGSVEEAANHEDGFILLGDWLLKDIQTTVQFSTGDDHNVREIQPSNGRKLYLMSAELLS